MIKAQGRSIAGGAAGVAEEGAVGGSAAGMLGEPAVGSPHICAVIVTARKPLELLQVKE